MVPKKILMVDDEHAFTSMMKLVLEQTGRYEVICENRATQAHNTARACQPDLILLDVVMPELDGGDVALQLQSDPALKDVPVVFLTALVGGKDPLARLAARDGIRCLGKLASNAELFQCIEDHLRPDRRPPDLTAGE